MSKLKLSAQEGRALIMALIVLAVGTLLIPPFLAYISTNLLASRATEEGMREQYAADAGVEYAIWKSANDPGFLVALSYSDQITLTMPTLVNAITPTVVVSAGVGSLPLGGFGSQIELGRDLNDVRFYNDDVGFAVGDKETVLKTYDGGWTWGQQRGVIGPGDPNFNSVFPVSPLDIWIVGKSGSDSLIMHNDGGDTWEFVDCPTGPELNSVFFVDADHGWAVGQKSEGKPTIVYYDGNTWFQSVQSDPNKDLNGVFFVDVSKGWAVGEGGTILRTADGGNTWEEASDNGGITEELYGVCFVDSENGWAVGANGTIVRSINGGVDWITQTVPSEVGTLRDVSFLIDDDGDWTNDVGWAVGSDGHVIRTNDSGDNWSSEINVSEALHGIHVNSATHGCAVGKEGIILIYEGSSWVVQNEFLVNDLQSVWMADETHAWLAGLGGAIAKTTDGMRWYPKDLPEEYKDVDLFGISFAGSYTTTTPGWAVGANGKIFKSSDAGETWIEQTSPVPSVQLNDVYAISADKVVAVGDSGTVITTTNGGYSWGSMNIGTTKNLNAVFFAPGAERGWAVGNKDGSEFTIYKTTDAGASWTSQSSAEKAEDLHGVSCINEQIAWAVGEGGTVLKLKKTIDGETWTDPRDDTGWPSTDLYSVFFDTTVDAGWAVGQRLGSIGWPPEEGSESGAYETADAGTSWEGLLTGTTTDIRDIFVIDPCHGWAVGDSGTLLRFFCAPGEYVGSWCMLVDIYSTADDTLIVSRIEVCKDDFYIYSWEIK